MYVDGLMKLEDFAHPEIIEWLLEPENPSVRYWTLLQLKNRSITDPEVKNAQEAIMSSPCVRDILGAQKDRGHWDDYDDMYLPKYTTTTHNLLILAELGAKRTPQIERAVEYLYQFQRNSGHFLTKLPKSEKGKDSVVNDGCCFDGNILYYLIHFGYLGDSRTRRLIEFQIDYHSDKDGGWKCRAFPIDPTKVFPINCFMGRIKVLKAIVKIPQNERNDTIKKIISQESNEILENQIYKYLRNPDGTRKEKAGWKKFGFPIFYQSDVLEVMDALTGLGVRDERMQESIDFIINSRNKQGTWDMKNTYNGTMICTIEEKNKPSKWITLRALRVLRRYLK